MFSSKDNRRLVTAIGLLTLYAVISTAYIFALSPKLNLLGNEQQKTLARAIELESRLRKVAKFTEEDDAFSVELRPDNDDPAITHAYVKRTSIAYPFASISNVYSKHYHPAELKGESLYIIRRMLDVDNEADFSDELWKYSITGKSERLYASQGMDFRTSPTGKLIAISQPHQLLLLRPNTGEERNIRWPELSGELEPMIEARVREYGSPPDVSLEEWSNDESAFWGRLHWAGAPEVFFRVNPITGSVKAYDVSVLKHFDEIALHPATGKVIYSTYPRLFDVNSQEEFEASEETVGLHLLDLLQNTDVLITESIARPFLPQWKDRFTVEYNDPDNQMQRIVQSIE